MKTFMLILGTFALITVFATFSSPAEAGDFGIHIGGRGYHIDVGRPHYGHVYYGGYGRGYRPYFDNYYGGGHVWHDTSHYDYHPGEFVRHRNHYHYVPGHWDYHETGHWDHYGW